MRYLILSDIHGNWEGLQAVLSQAKGRYDNPVCCGDLVGYGADPNAVTEWVRHHCTAVIRGNHDRACSGLDDLEWFNPMAKAAALWTQQALTPENLDYIRQLPKGPKSVDGFQLVHGSPLDEDHYLIYPEDFADLRGYLDEPLWFFGHTHLQGAIQLHRNGVRPLAAVPEGESQWVIALEPDTVYLVNPGSVGQPRDGDARAGYAIYDSGERVVELHRVGYPIAETQRKILEAGLPPLLAHRLGQGR